MDAQEAVQILNSRGDIVAAELKVSEGSGWRDLTGTGHLIIRGAFSSLERMNDGNPSPTDAANAMGTVGFAPRTPASFQLENVVDVADVALKILLAETQKETDISKVVTPDDVKLLTDNLQKFNDDLKGQSASPDADPALKAYSSVLEVANDHYQEFAKKLMPALAPAPAPSTPTAGPKTPKP